MTDPRPDPDDDDQDDGTLDELELEAELVADSTVPPVSTPDSLDDAPA